MKVTLSNLKNILVTILLSIVSYAHSQTINTVFKPFSLDQGHINDIMRDSEGFLWISTQDGLSKYNGTHFIQYNYNRKDTNTIAHNYIWKTFEDSRTNIWVGLFGGGMCKYNKQKDSFLRYSSYKDLANHGVRCFDQLNDSTLLVGTDHGLYLFDLNTYSFYQDSTFIKNQFDAGLYHTHSMEVIGEDIIVAGENGGFILSTTTKTVEKIDCRSLGVQQMNFIKKLDENRFFIADNNKFIETIYNSNTRKFIVTEALSSEQNIAVNDVSVDLSGEILLVAEEGLFKLSFEKKKLLSIPNDTPEKNNLFDRVAYCVETIEPNLKWIGTKTHIYEFSEKKKAFHHILSEQLCGSAILGLAEDSNGNLWVATRRGLGRIKHFNKSKSEWEFYCYNKTTNPEMRNDYILNIKVIKDMILIGYRKNGFSILSHQGENRLKFLDPPKNVDDLTSSASVSNFFLDNNKVWISTSGNGVIKWDIQDKSEVKQYINKDGAANVLSHNYSFGFEELDQDWIAVATAYGISVIHKNKDSTYQIIGGVDSLSLSGNFIMDFHKDSDGRLWVCTDGGINLWNEGGTFKSWTKNDGLPNEIIYGMLEKDETLWISSNKGLVRFNKAHAPKFTTFSKVDNVLNDEHNQFSFYKSQNDKLLFGGKDGITMFDPDDITPNPISAIPVIESFQLFNKNGESKLSNHINYTDQIILNHDENFLSFELASLSYFQSDQNQYRYILKPLNDDWIEMENRNFITLNGLAPGRYMLYIQASNNDKIWGNEIKSLEIIIKRPIYTRWYAWLFYFSVISSIVYAFYKIKLNHITNLSKAREEERTKIRERSARDFHDEVGALVTKLSLLNQYLLSNISEESKENISILNKMQSNIQRIRTGMKDFIWVLDPNKDSLGSAIIKIKEIGNDLFEHSGIKFQCNVDNFINKNYELNGVQRRQLVLLIKEALHNILKHSKANVCTIEISQSSNVLKFIILDDGVGFDIDSYSSGYGLKSMKERARKMSGQVEFQSSKENGTRTIVSIPTHPNGL